MFCPAANECTRLDRVVCLSLPPNTIISDDDLASLLMGDKADFDVLDQGIPIDLSYQHDKYRQQGGMLIGMERRLLV